MSKILKRAFIKKFDLQHFATGTTKLTNMVNPQVMADMIEADINSANGKFDSITKEDNTLVGQPGSVITVPQWAYIGDAADLTEGVAMDTEVMSNSTTSATIKSVGKGVDLTDQAVLSGFGDPMGTAASQIAASIVQKKDKDIAVALDTATTVQGDGTTVVVLADILKAKALFGDEDDENIEFRCHPHVYNDIIALCDALTTNLGDYIKEAGALTQLYGMKVIKTNKCTQTNTGATAYFNSYLSKANAVKVYNKRGTAVETDRDIKAKLTTITADKHYVAVLDNQSKSVTYKAKHALA